MENWQEELTTFFEEEEAKKDANREMFGDDTDYFEVAGMDDVGCK